MQKKLFLTYSVFIMPYAHKKVVIICKILGRFQENKSKNQQIRSKNRKHGFSKSPKIQRPNPKDAWYKNVKFTDLVKHREPNCCIK